MLSTMHGLPRPESPLEAIAYYFYKTTYVNGGHFWVWSCAEAGALKFSSDVAPLKIARFVGICRLSLRLILIIAGDGTAEFGLFVSRAF